MPVRRRQLQTRFADTQISLAHADGKYLLLVYVIPSLFARPLSPALPPDTDTEGVGSCSPQTEPIASFNIH
jgi:hypothetical protein